MPKVNPIINPEYKKNERTQTEVQKKNTAATVEGVVVNSFIKDSDINGLYDSMVISDNAKLPQKLNEKEPNSKEKSLTPISLVATGVMGAMLLATVLIKKSAFTNLNITAEKKLDHLTRNVSITDESIQSLYQIIQCPNQKTILAGTGALVLGAMGFMGKMFLDGFKDVWVKKKEADIQKNLQENLIAVETQSFSGKIQIIRSMLADKAREFNEYLNLKKETPTTFKKLMSFERPAFKGHNESYDIVDKKENNLKYFAMGALTLGSIVGLGYLSIKNLGSGKKHLDEFIQKSKGKISEIITKTTDSTKQTDKNKLINIFEAIDSKPHEIRETLSNANWKEEDIEEILSRISKSTTKADSAIGGDGTPKPAFNSYVSDYRAFFYNYLLDRGNPQFKMLFYSVTGLTALSYGGKNLGEAVKEVQVKKMNAQTELELQRKLVSTELRNFKAKKDAAITPLTEEFYKQVLRGKPKEELKVIAENILNEVKNGPPFVYS